MARVAGACCGLIVFSAMVLRGMLAGNSAETVLTRALTGLIGGAVLGAILARIGLAVVADSVAKNKQDEDAPGGGAKPDAAVARTTTA